MKSKLRLATFGATVAAAAVASVGVAAINASTATAAAAAGVASVEAWILFKAPSKSAKNFC